MTVRRSLAQQEEYRVRDTDGEPRTEAGRRMLVGLLDYDALPPDRMGWNRDAIRAIEAEAALLARPVDRLPDNALYSSAVTHGYHTQSGDHECREYVVGVCALPALLARRAPGDRGNLPLIEAAELVLAARDSVGLEAMPVDLWAAIDTLRFGLKAVGHPWTGALAADSRPEPESADLGRRAPGDRDALREALEDALEMPHSGRTRTFDGRSLVRCDCAEHQHLYRALAADSRPEQAEATETERLRDDVIAAARWVANADRIGEDDIWHPRTAVDALSKIGAGDRVPLAVENRSNRAAVEADRLAGSRPEEPPEQEPR